MTTNRITKAKIDFLKIIYCIFDFLSNFKRLNKYVKNGKLYIGSTIISLSMLNLSCNTGKKSEQTDINIVKQKSDTLNHLIKKESAEKIDSSREENNKTINHLSDKKTQKNTPVKIEEIQTEVYCYDVAIEDPIPEKIVLKIDLETDTLTLADQMPEFPGGYDSLHSFISKNLIYPQAALENWIQGKVYIRFVVTNKGEIYNTKIIRGIDPLLDSEAIRIMQIMPKWKPGVQDSIKVNTWFTIPIDFRIPNEK
jgi:TonB family protein